MSATLMETNYKQFAMWKKRSASRRPQDLVTARRVASQAEVRSLAHRGDIACYVTLVSTVRMAREMPPNKSLQPTLDRSVVSLPLHFFAVKRG